jgi:integrase
MLPCEGETERGRTMKDKTITWYGDGLYSRAATDRDGRPLKNFYGRVWIKARQGNATFKIRARTEKSARRKLAAIQLDPDKALKARELKPKAAAPIRFDALADRFLAGYHSRGGTAYYRHVAESWRAAFGNAPVTAITRPRVEAYREKLRADGYGDSTIRKYVGALGTLFRWAMLSCDPPLASVNPVMGVKRPSEPDHEVEILHPDEEAKLLIATTGELRPLVELCIASGLRKGEALSLTWAKIDRASGNILIPKSKTGKARSVPLTPALTAILGRVTKREDSAFVFHNEAGRPWQDRAASRALERALERAGIRKRVEDGGGEYQGVFNLLRHTFGSRRAAAGVPFGVIAKLMGNSVRVCERHYIRFAASDLKAAMLAEPAQQVQEPVQAPTGAGTGAGPDRQPQRPIGNHSQVVAE